MKNLSCCTSAQFSITSISTIYFILTGAPPTFSTCVSTQAGINMALKFFKSSTSLLSVKDRGIGEEATKKAIAAILWLLEESSHRSRAQRQQMVQNLSKNTLVSFSAEQRGSIRRYAAEHSNATTVKKIPSDLTDSCIQLLLNNCLWLVLFEKKIALLKLNLKKITKN